MIASRSTGASAGILAVILSFGASHCPSKSLDSEGAQGTVDRDARALAAGPALHCPKPVPVRVDVFGSYTMFSYDTGVLSEAGSPPRLGFVPEGRAPASELQVWQQDRYSTSPAFGFDDAGAMTHAPVVVFTLPSHPAIALPPRDLCSVDVGDSFVTATCLDDKGGLQTRKLEFPQGCVQVTNGVGTRDLASVERAWRATVAGCQSSDASPPRVHHTPVVLALQKKLVPKEDCAMGCLDARLLVPELGITRHMGLIPSLGVCNSTRLDDPPGLEFGCSDEATSTASTYQVGSKLFYSTAPSEEARKDIAGANGLATVDLPCGVVADFRFQGAPPAQ